MLAGGRNSRCNPLDESPFSFLLCVSFLLVTPPPMLLFAFARDVLSLPPTASPEVSCPACPDLFGRGLSAVLRLS